MSKSIYIFIACCLLAILPAAAQPVSSFGFSSRVGTYEEISGGTVLGAGLLDKDFDNIAFNGSSTGVKVLNTDQGFPIGFDFSFNNTKMNRFAIGSHGYIILGKDEVTVNPVSSNYMFMKPDPGKANIIGTSIMKTLFGSDTTSVSYKLVDTTQDRVLVVQYKNLGVSLDFSGTTRMAVSLQIRLYEKTGNIEFVFKDWGKIRTNASISLRMGLMGVMENDRHLRVSNEEDWTKTVKSSVDRSTSWRQETTLPDGLTFTFISPNMCEKPASQPTKLKLSPTSIKVDGSFDGLSSADNYLTVISETATLNVLPEDGKYYKPEEKLGNATVIAFDTLTSFIMPEALVLEGAKQYYFHVFAVNSFCAYGPLYNTVNPLTGIVSTRPVRPDTLKIAETGFDYVMMDAVKNAANNQIVVAQTTIPAIDKLSNTTINGKFGTPVGELNLGDEIEGGGVVVYKGDASGSFKAEGLKDNSVYYFGAFSMNENGEYSSTIANARVQTWGRLPYIPALQEIHINPVAFGWQIEGGIFRSTKDAQQKDVLECDIRVADALNGKINSITTQWLMLEEGLNRIMFNYRMTTWSRPTGDLPYNEWEEKDLFEIQISENGTDFETIYSVNKLNAPKLASAASWASPSVVFDKFNGKKVKVRIYWKCHKVVKLVINDLLIEQKPDCEYPVNVSVDKASLVGSNALVAWTAKGEEEIWEIQYRVEGTEEWSTPVETFTNPYLFTTLPPRSNVALRVRAKCSLTSLSAWSEPVWVTTGWEIPFAESFDTESLPLGWNVESGMIADSTSFCSGSYCKKYWTLENNMLSVDYNKVVADWLILPVVDLGDGSSHYKLDFDLTKTGTGDGSADTYLAVVVSSSEGKKFSPSGIIKKWSQVDGTFASLGNSPHYSVSLKGHTGKVRIALYATTDASFDGKITLDNLSILETCPSAKHMTVSEITGESAKVKWDGEEAEWKYFIRKAGETSHDFKTVAERELLLDNLTPQTTYEVGITKSCGMDDQAKLMIKSFTTLSLEPCLQVTNIVATPSQQAVVIGWTSEAMKYNVKFRQLGTENWNERVAQTNSIEIKGLETETEYEYSIQTVCSQAEGDKSEWTEVDKFTTLAVTCFPPTDISATPTHNSVSIVWKGESDKYEVAYRLESATQWTTVQIQETKQAKIEGLNALSAYTIRLRSICSVSETSAWSTTVNFTTSETPVCAIPTNLNVSGITDTSVNLSWDADESNLTWDVRYRESVATSWKTEKGLTQKNHAIAGLTAYTAYLWSVKATCHEERTSAWAGQENFTTLATHIGSVGLGVLKVYASKGIINIANPKNVRINSVLLFEVNGSLIREYNISSDENVWIPTDLESNQVIVKVVGENFNTSYTLILK